MYVKLFYWQNLIIKCAHSSKKIILKMKLNSKSTYTLLPTKFINLLKFIFIKLKAKTNKFIPVSHLSHHLNVFAVCVNLFFSYWLSSNFNHTSKKTRKNTLIIISNSKGYILFLRFLSSIFYTKSITQRYSNDKYKSLTLDRFLYWSFFLKYFFSNSFFRIVFLGGTNFKCNDADTNLTGNCNWLFSHMVINLSFLYDELKKNCK